MSKLEFPWYDSQWLGLYYQACELVQKATPNKLQSFERSFDVLRTDKNFTPVSLSGHFHNKLSELKQVIDELPKEQLEQHELFTFGRHVVHNHSYATNLQNNLTGFVSELAGEELEPAYNFLAMYHNFGYCEPHMDSPISKWTLDICIEQSDIWPIFFSQIVSWPTPKENRERSAQWQKEILMDERLKFNEYLMQPGDAVFFSGSSQWHYRPRIKQRQEQNFCHLLFLHYIPKGTADLINPNRWAELFNIPELGAIQFTDYNP